MNILKREVPSNCELILFGDDQVGNLLSHREEYNKCIDYIASDRNRFAVHMGDEMDAFWVDDKRFNYDITISTPIAQQKEVIKDLMPIASTGQLFTILFGNHTFKLLPKVGDITADTCERLGIEYSGTTCVLELFDRHGLMFKTYLTHGRRGIRSSCDDPIRRIANMRLQLKKHLYNMAGDCLVMAKGHCLSDDTEVLTDSGWKWYDEITQNDKVMTFNMSNNVAEFNSIQQIHIHNNEYRDMLHFKNSVTDIMVTKDHRMITSRTVHSDDWIESKAIDIFGKKTFAIPTTGTSGNPEYVISDDWLKLIGWLISEGHFRENGSIQLFQNVSNHKIIANLLDKLGIPHSIYYRKFSGRAFNDPRSGKQYTTKEDSCTFYITIENSKPILEHIKDKNIPKHFINNLSDRQVRVLIEAMICGDGTFNYGRKSAAYYTASQKLADDLQALCITHGIRCSLKPKNGTYVLNMSFDKSSKKYMFKSNGVREVLPATRIAWCLSVENGTLFIRRNGKVSVVGNTHKLLIAEPEPILYMTHTDHKIKQKYTEPSEMGGEPYISPELRWYVNTGSFLKSKAIGVTSYPEMYEYEPLEMGYAVVEIFDRKVVNIRKEII